VHAGCSQGIKGTAQRCWLITEGAEAPVPCRLTYLIQSLDFTMNTELQAAAQHRERGGV
jgi:hypothetical protein